MFWDSWLYFVTIRSSRCHWLDHCWINTSSRPYHAHVTSAPGTHAAGEAWYCFISVCQCACVCVCVCVSVCVYIHVLLWGQIRAKTWCCKVVGGCEVRFLTTRSSQIECWGSQWRRSKILAKFSLHRYFTRPCGRRVCVALCGRVF